MKKLMAMLAVCALGNAANAFAADVNITFSGEIVLPTCTVDPNSVSMTVALDAANANSDFQSGLTAKAKSFTLSLINCAPNTNVSMIVNGATDTTVTSVLKNTQATQAADQVRLQLLLGSQVNATTGTPITIGNSLTIGAVNPTTNALDIPMVVQYYKLGTLTAGLVAANATVNFSYN